MVAPVDPKRRRPEVYSNDIADAMEADLQPLATSGLVTRISKAAAHNCGHICLGLG